VNPAPAPGNFGRADYAARGWNSVHTNPHGTNQTALDLGKEYAAPHHEVTFDDLPQEHQQQIIDHVSKNYGRSYEDLVHNAGRSIDNAFARQHEANRASAFTANRLTEAKGQRWYAGGPGSAQEDNQSIGREHGVPPHIVGAMRAAVSPNNSAKGEVPQTRAVIAGMRNNPDPEQFSAEGTPSEGMHWASRNAARILQAHEQSGTHPSQVVGRPQRGNAPVPAVTGSKSGPKPLSYNQAYADPGVANGRPTVDRWAYRGAFGVDDVAAKQIQGHKLKGSKVPDPSRPGSEIHGVNLLTAKAIADASSRRGLMPHEGQAIQWNEDKDEAEGRHKQPAGHPSTGNNLNAGQFHDPNQGSLF
jgi:hypothetical protein